MTTNNRDNELFKKALAGPMPAHIAIIMDGNGRWATAKGLTRLAGHRAGAEVLEDILALIKQLHIKYFTVYAFSTENWKRPKDEVDGLMSLLIEYVDRKADKFMREDIQFNTIGDLSALPPKAQEKVNALRTLTKDNRSVCFNIALNYGGRHEILNAVRALAEEVQDGKIAPEEINERIFSEHLYTAGQPDPDLLIRSSGEFRLSNFLLWQIAYTEIWMTDVLWPDFDQNNLLQAIVDYQKRDRRFGGIKKVGGK